MAAAKKSIGNKIAVILVGVLALAAQSFAQGTQNPKPEQTEDVVRVYSDLVQTDVMVFDKQGHFVNGLKREDFELRIDGKPQPIEFFERVTAGSSDEESKLSAARGTAPAKRNKSAAPLDRGRTVFFFLDDLHLSAANLEYARRMLSHFIDKDMGQNDEAAITSTTGQIGFLQQLTDNKAVLRAAVDRIKLRQYAIHDLERPPMSQYQALQIDHYNRDLTDYFVEQVMRDSPGLSRDQATAIVRSRAQQILSQAAFVTTNTLASLESLVQTSSKLAGRKLLFFVSDGFFLDDRNSDAHERLRRITSAAARSGVVIYSIDARGLVATLSDASNPGAFDPSGRVDRGSTGELPASQDALNALARDTGGRPIFNTNALDQGVTNALSETSVYYLLAWRPDHETQAKARFRRIGVSLLNHADLSVRVRQGFFDLEPTVNAKHSKSKEPASQAEPAESSLSEALAAVYPETALPLSINLNYLNTPQRGIMLTASMQLRAEAFEFATEGTKTKALVDITGAVYNADGKPGAGFTDRLTITSGSLEELRRTGKEVVYNYQVYLQPGLYQIRMGARDSRSGKIGTAQQWVEIPDLASHKLALSSLFAGERAAQVTPPAADKTDADGTAMMRVDRRYHRDSFLRFVVYIYNATRAAAESMPDVSLQLQILRDQQPVITTPSKKILPGEQSDQLWYGADVSLEGLSSGRYVLQVTAIDRVSKSSATQTMRFEIE